MPKISIIMPCYNEEENLENAVDSILNQTFADFELIIVDDCSTDNTHDILKKYEKKDKRIRVLTNKVNMGIAVSLNNGIRAARGDYIARMDADDVSMPERLEKQYKYMEGNSDVVLLGTWCENIDTNGNRLKITPPSSHDKIKEALKKDNPFVHSSVMFKKYVASSEPEFYSDVKGFEDYDLWIRLGGYGKYHIIDEVLVVRKEDNNFKTRKLWEGLSKNYVYRMRLRYQMKAMKKFGYSFNGAFFCLKTMLSILISCLK